MSFKGSELEKHMCIYMNNYAQLITLVVFLLGFMVFKYIVFKETKTERELSETKQRKSKMAEDYLNLHKQENEEFFFGTSSNDFE